MSEQIDQFSNLRPMLDSPARNFFLIEPSDSEQLPERPRAIRVGIAGDVAVIGDHGVEVLFENCYAGEVLPIRPIQIKASGTTASNLVALV
ncbi:hypothetical protein HDG34_005880 [Paraburkholderia sp. HC6.4b]|uniref:spike base protein, RCAP_Rcc01079 family n=1 Tax=unclassified Paraburkholderia TaxID=2615204 RepID=UPI00160F8B16|nr:MULTISPECIES: hypothetical protein [unclassified Paraburkholderia]MBB5411914.1 hypothetical protein [Paraburkholderia sp. HC6.4b]MBB5450226.1 hypothetical protein [Paraburkholderia sp. Kb1A]